MQLRTLLLAVLLALTAGCGLTPQTGPQRVPPEPAPTALSPSPSTTGIVQIYLVRGERLVPVERAGRTADDALALLAAGPTALDGGDGFVTYLPPRAIGRAVRQEPGVLAVEVTADVAALPAREQVLAVAQLVWTATGVCCDTEVHLLVDGRPIPVPTDGGPVQRPARRDDFRSVAPA